MVIRKYLVDNINEALFRIKHELGDDAYIISQKMVRQPGVKGFFSNKKIEVTVGLLNKDGVEEKNLLSSSEIKNNVLESTQNFQTQVQNSFSDQMKNNSSQFQGQQFSIPYSQTAYTQNDTSKSMSYYNKLFEEKQKMFNNPDNVIGSYDIPTPQKISQEQENNFQLRSLSDVDKLKNESSIIDLNLKQNEESNLRKNFNGNQNDFIERVIPKVEQKISTENINLKNDLDEIKSMIKEITGTKKYNEKVHLSYLDEVLEKHDVCKELCDEIKSKCNLTEEELMDERTVKKYLRNVFSNIIKIYDEDIHDKFVVVGPTGSGKTTTIAKLAGTLSLNFNKKVGLVTIDTFRVGAVEQLKMYADIMSIPYKSVMSLNDIRSVFDDMRDRDVILVDTIGRGNKNIIQINELSMFVQSIQSHDVSLVVNAGMKYQDIELFLESLKGIKFTNIIVTKVDETNSFGMLVNLCYKLSIPISFLTIGQEVPLDIRKADKKEILDIILGEERL